MKTITDIVVNGTTFPYLGPKPGFNIGILLYDDNGETKEVRLTKIEDVVTV